MARYPHQKTQETRVRQKRTDPLSQRSRTALLETAAELFALCGIDGVTIRQIADRAGVNINAVSYYFNGKEGLYRACLENYGRSRVQNVLPLLTSVRSRTEFEIKLRLIVETSIRSALEHRPLAIIAMREFETGLPIGREIIEDTILRLNRELCAFFLHAQKAGYLTREMDPAVASHILQGAIAHLIRVDGVRKQYSNLSLQDPAECARAVDTLTRIFLKGSLAA